MKKILFIIGIVSITSVFSQENENKQQKQNNDFDWFNKDYKTDSVQGISYERAYQILKFRQPKTVIVGVVDSGVDINHEDLKANIWVNPNEIPNNGIDDDKNGFVDDVNGWNFLGNAKGEMVNHDNLEIARLYKKYSKQFKGKESISDVRKKYREDFILWKKIEKNLNAQIEKTNMQLMSLQGFENMYNSTTKTLKEKLGKDKFTIEDLNNIKTENLELIGAISFHKDLLSKDFSMEELSEYKEHLQNKVQYNLNPDYAERDKIVDTSKKGYGNNKVKGSVGNHGTHVAGIIAAVRDNKIGMNGVAGLGNIKILPVRAVPDGDERDEDVANAIRYAVDNGARVINMSFGKKYSWDKQLVDKAMEYAQEKGVMLIHSAGNDGLDRDNGDFFPNKYYENSDKKANNWITVGAYSSKKGNNKPASFSNYGTKNVDLFSPGVDIYSLKPNNKYAKNSGTSMAGPVVTGVVATLMSYYPELSTAKIKEIIMKSVVKSDKIVAKPKSGQQVPFSSLSVSGGFVNLYRAVILAEAELMKM